MILRNAFKTPDGTIIESTHVHDFQCHTDANGKTYCTDGGHDYIRTVGDIEDCENLCVESDDFKVIREYLTWGTYGKNGDKPLKQIKIKDLSNLHLEAIIDTQHLSAVMTIALNAEYYFRLANNITIKDYDYYV